MASTISVVDSIYSTSIDARPSNYLVNHISFGKPPQTLNWYGLKLVRSTQGYPQTPLDGVTIYSTTTDDTIYYVSTVSASGGITGLTALNTTGTPTVTVTSASLISVSGGKGRGASISLPTSGGYTIVSAGNNYSVNDIVRVAGDITGLPGKTSSTQLGVSNYYHVYDTGATTAVTTNPGYGSTGTEINTKYAPIKYYYSLFTYYATSTSITPTTAPPSPNLSWKKVGDASSFVVRANSTRDTVSTILDHIPSFYKMKNESTVNKDLQDFLSLFAFQVDLYLTETNSVYNMTDLRYADEELLKSFLKEFGTDMSFVDDLKQARKLLKNLIYTYELSGTVQGLSNLIEGYTGYSVTAISGKNLLPDYNTSSFIEGIGSWYPDYKAINSYAFNTNSYNIQGAYTSPYAQNISVAQMPTSSIDSYYSWYGDTTSAYNVSMTAASGSTSTTVNVDDTSDLIVGNRLWCLTNGVFATGTVVTSIVSSTQFKINLAPTTAITSGALILASTNTPSNSLKIINPATAGAGTGDVTYYSGLRKATLAAAGSVTGSSFYGATSTVVAYPAVAKPGDYVYMAPASVQFDPSQKYYFAEDNVVVTGVDYTTNAVSGVTVSFNKDITADILAYSAPVVYFSQTPMSFNGDNINSVSPDLIPITPSTPYTFSMQFNANNGTTRTTSVALTWLDSKGSVISTSTGTTAAPNGTLPVPNANYAKVWFPTSVTANSPSNAAYVTPSFTIKQMPASSTVAYYADSAMLHAPVQVKSYSVSGTTVTVNTVGPHNFFPGQSLAVQLAGVTTYNSSGWTVGTVTQNTDTRSYSFTYTIPFSATVSTTLDSGYVSSLPYTEVYIGGDRYPITLFEDAGLTKLNVNANRINMIHNPSFELTTNYWGTYNATKAIASGGVSGTQAVQVTCSTTTTAITGLYAGNNTSGSQRLPITAGHTYTLSAYVKDVSVGTTVQANIEWYSAFTGGSVISTATGTATSISTSGWTRLSVTGVAPGTASYATPTIYTVAAVTNGKQFLIEDVLLEDADSVLVYFDGSFDGYSYDDTRDTMWEGSKHASKSHLYNNRVLNLGNIDAIAPGGMYYA